MSRYTVTAVSHYAGADFANRREAIRHARSITDTLNHKATVRDTTKRDRDGNALAIAGYAWTPNDGGKTYKTNVD